MREPWYQPAHRKRGTDTDGQERNGALACDLRNQRRDRVEGRGEPGQQRLALPGERQPIRMAVEQREPEAALEQSYDAADRSLGHGKLLRRRLEAAEARR